MAERFGVTMTERTVGKLPRRLGFVRLSVRPRHPAHGAAAQAAHAATPAPAEGSPAAAQAAGEVQ